jgi:D-xylose transport system ATP-binding protein
MVASVEVSQTTSDDVVGYITGSKTYTGVNL